MVLYPEDRVEETGGGGENPEMTLGGELKPCLFPPIPLCERRRLSRSAGRYFPILHGFPSFFFLMQIDTEPVPQGPSESRAPPSGKVSAHDFVSERSGGVF